MARTIHGFEAIFPNAPLIQVLDIGSNPTLAHAAPPSYTGLLKRGRCIVTGFEPSAVAYEALEKTKGPFERYFPFAIGDGTTQTFYECTASVLSSLYKPNLDLLKHFHLLSEAAQIVSTCQIDTKRLDDIADIGAMDYIHMDVQGAELQCLQSGHQLLRDVLVVQAETNLLPMYHDQPMFSEVELYLRSQGFMLHRLENVQKRTWKPLCLNGDVLQGFSQWFWGDAIFVRDIATWPKMSAAALFKMACVMHEVYHAFDLVQLILLMRDQTHGTQDAGLYFQVILQDVPELVQMPKNTS